MFLSRKSRLQKSVRVRNLSGGFEQFEMRRMLHGGVDDGAEAEGIGESISSFDLLDVNPTSSTYNQVVSPSDFSSQTTLWYFGHST